VTSGVDTHLDIHVAAALDHVAAALDRLGALLGTERFDTDPRWLQSVVFILLEALQCAQRARPQSRDPGAA
jgi:hypothetical protein